MVIPFTPRSTSAAEKGATQQSRSHSGSGSGAALLAAAEDSDMYLANGGADLANTTTITVTLAGCLLRHGCSILFELTTNFRVVAGEALSVHVVDLTPPCYEQSVCEVQRSEREVFLQAVLHNVTAIPLELLSYALVQPTESGVSKSAVSVLDGPTDIAVHSERTDSSQDVTTLLMPGERYFGAFILSAGTNCLFYVCSS